MSLLFLVVLALIALIIVKIVKTRKGTKPKFVIPQPQLTFTTVRPTTTVAIHPQG